MKKVEEMVQLGTAITSLTVLDWLSRCQRVVVVVDEYENVMV